VDEHGSNRCYGNNRYIQKLLLVDIDLADLGREDVVEIKIVVKGIEGLGNKHDDSDGLDPVSLAKKRVHLLGISILQTTT
jgi:hypothetical protein